VAQRGLGEDVAGVALDIEPKPPVPGVEFVLGAQDDPRVIRDIVVQHAPLDVVVDDASHEMGKTIRSFELLWPAVAPGGLYFVEDLTTSYLRAWGGNPAPGAGGTAVAFFKDLVDAVHNGHYVDLPGVPTDVAAVGFWPGLVVVQKTALR